MTFPKIWFLSDLILKFPNFSLTFAWSGISLIFPWLLDTLRTYSKVSNIRRTKSQNLNDFRLILQLSLPNPLKSGVKWSTILLPSHVWLILEVWHYVDFPNFPWLASEALLTAQNSPCDLYLEVQHIQENLRYHQRHSVTFTSEQFHECFWT